MYNNISNAKSDFKYKINEINVAKIWNPKAKNSKDFGGFNYCTEKCILRWLHRSDTIYDVIIPKDAENIKLIGKAEIYKANKIIITNPRKIYDKLALHFYKISKIQKEAYYKDLPQLALWIINKQHIKF